MTYRALVEEPSGGSFVSAKLRYGIDELSTRTDPNGKFGSNGAFKLNLPGRNNMEVQSGHRDETDKARRRDYNYATDGCTRTTDEATKAIKELNKTDRVNTMQVHDSCPSWMR